MTYRKLIDRLNGLSEEQLNQDVTVYDPRLDEYFAVNSLSFSKDDDVLNKGHSYLIMD
jgi:hypothetical protein